MGIQIGELTRVCNEVWSGVVWLWCGMVWYGAVEEEGRRGFTKAVAPKAKVNTEKAEAKVSSTRPCLWNLVGSCSFCFS